MSCEKANAIILRTIDFSETSCIVTLFSREFGKFSALAKGARRPKGPFESAIDVLAVCRVVFLRKNNEGLDLLTEAKLQRSFRAVRFGLEGLYAGYYIAELLGELSEEYDPHPNLYDVADRTLSELSSGRYSPEMLTRFELLALLDVGLMPSLDFCVECGRPIPESGRTAFGMLSGGVLCPSCRPGRRQVVSVSRDALVRLKQLAGKEEPIGTDGDVEKKVCGELRGLMNGYITHVVGRRMRTQKYIGA